MDTRKIRRQAKAYEQDNDGLGLLGLAKQCCDEIDRLKKLVAEARLGIEAAAGALKAGDDGEDWRKQLLDELQDTVGRLR